MVKLKKLGIIFIMFFVIIIMSACNDKDDPLYINAMSFFFDNNVGAVEIKNKKQDVYLENPDETFYAGVSFDITEKKKGKDKENIYSYYYDKETVIDSCFKKGSSIKLITTKKTYEYKISISSYFYYGGISIYEDSKDHTDFNLIEKSLLPEHFIRIHTHESISKISIEKGETVGLFCDMSSPSFDRRPLFNGEVGFKSLNQNVTINTISNINPYSNNKLLYRTTYINITYNGDDGELDLSDIAFEQVSIE